MSLSVNYSYYQKKIHLKFANVNKWTAWFYICQFSMKDYFSWRMKAIEKVYGTYTFIYGHCAARGPMICSPKRLITSYSHFLWFYLTHLLKLFINQVNRRRLALIFVVLVFRSSWNKFIYLIYQVLWFWYICNCCTYF